MNKFDFSQKRFNIKIERAEYAGACYGVERALCKVIEARQLYDDVSTFGELIHNPLVVNDLKNAGVGVIENEMDAHGCVVLRSHGTPPDTQEKISEKAQQVIDATCPYVIAVQRSAIRFVKEGFDVIVVGEQGHEEVESIVGCANCAGEGNIIVVNSVEQLPKSFENNIGIVSQTTQRYEDFERIVSEIKARRNNDVQVKVANTICSSTQRRQDAAEKLSNSSDIIFVLGGKNSSNTKRLFEICARNCKKSYFIENPIEAKELILDYLNSFLHDTKFGKGLNIENQSEELKIGITGGASTPKSQLDELEEILKTVRP